MQFEKREERGGKGGNGNSNTHVRHGVKPAKLDARDFSFHRTFPHFADRYNSGISWMRRVLLHVAPRMGQALPALPLLEYSYDISGTKPDQNADGLYYGCTGYTQTHLKGNQDGTQYSPSYTYIKTCLMEGHAADQGCDIRISAKSLRVYGALKKENETRGEAHSSDDVYAAKNKSGQTFTIDRAPGRDWFDSFRIALRAQKQGISIGTPWFAAFAGVGSDGILSMPDLDELAAVKRDPNAGDWHNHAFYGEVTIKGQPHIRDLSWQGANIGDAGYLYFDREVFNAIFDVYGTLGIITAVAAPADIQTIKLDLLQTVVTYLNRILAIIMSRQLVLHA